MASSVTRRCLQSQFYQAGSVTGFFGLGGGKLLKFFNMFYWEREIDVFRKYYFVVIN
jgi:hypothetical protein